MKKRLRDFTGQCLKDFIQCVARKKKKQTLAGQKEEQWNKVSVGDWSKKLEKYKSDRATKDPLSRFDGMSQLSNSDSESLERFGVAASTDISMGDQYRALVEIRCLERGVPTERWAEIAENVAKFVENINKEG